MFFLTVARETYFSIMVKAEEDWLEDSKGTFS
jgi:hypothetical protein